MVKTMLRFLIRTCIDPEYTPEAIDRAKLLGAIVFESSEHLLSLILLTKFETKLSLPRPTESIDDESLLKTSCDSRRLS